MLYLYFGTDTTKVRSKALATATEVGQSVLRFEADTFVPGSLREAVQSTPLFGDAVTYVIDTPSTNPDLWAEMVALISEQNTTSNTFIIIDDSLTAAQQKQITPYAAGVEEYKKNTVAPFNTFALADALANRDKKTLWILLVESMKRGQSAEEIIGVLWWQLKALRVAAVTRSAAEADMKEYPYTKAKRALTLFHTNELESLSLQLLAVYHQGHSGEKDIWLGLEEWVLGV